VSSGFALESAPYSVGWNMQGITPPSSLYILPDDTISFQAYNTATPIPQIELHVRMLGSDGVIRLEVIPMVGLTSDGTFHFVDTQLGEGFLLSALVISTAHASQLGQTWSGAVLRRGPSTGFDVAQIFLNGYVASTSLPVWPGGTIRRPSEGPGALLTYAPGNPAAGAEVSIVVPLSARWRPMSVRAVLQTSAVAGNRQPQLVITDAAGHQLFAGAVNSAQAANTAWGWNFGPGLTTGFSGNNQVNNPLPTGLYIPPGATFSTNTAGLQAADQWSVPTAFVEEWITF